MKIIIKQVSGSEIYIDSDLTDTIVCLKYKVSIVLDKSLNDIDIKLIYKGKILDDSKSLNNYQYEEGGLIIAIIKSLNK